MQFNPPPPPRPSFALGAQPSTPAGRQSEFRRTPRLVDWPSLRPAGTLPTRSGSAVEVYTERKGKEPGPREEPRLDRTVSTTPVCRDVRACWPPIETDSVRGSGLRKAGPAVLAVNGTHVEGCDWPSGADAPTPTASTVECPTELPALNLGPRRWSNCPS